MKKIIDYAHLFLTELCDDSKIFIDFTLGNGHDSGYFCNKVAQLFAFDIQQQAINQSLSNYPILKNATLILDGHQNVDQYINAYDLGIFNLGYLPNSDKTITTTTTTTLIALEKAINLLNKKGRLVIVVYVGHEAGKQESESIAQFLSTLNQLKIAKFHLINKPLAPYIYIIDK